MMTNEEDNDVSDVLTPSTESVRAVHEAGVAESEGLVRRLDKILRDIAESPIKEDALAKQEAREQGAVIARAEEEVRFQETQRHGVEAYYELRNRWSRYLACFLGGSIFFQFLLTVAIGAKWLDFTQSEAVLKMVIGENFLQIAGMGYIIVRFLYPDQKPDQQSDPASSKKEPPK